MKKKFFAVFALAAAVLIVFAACTSRDNDDAEQQRNGLQADDALTGGAADTQNENGGDTPAPAVEIGQLIEFGGWDWRVLDIDGNYAKILTENVIFERAYHDRAEGITWANSEIRAYLNGTFFNSFSAADRARIRETYVINNDNPWTITAEIGVMGRTPGGANTTDRIFLLSIEEVVRYVGGSEELLELGRDESNLDGSVPGLFGTQLAESYEILDTRIARDAEGTASAWFLRSPGWMPPSAAFVSHRGVLFVGSNQGVSFELGIRPALWLNLES